MLERKHGATGRFGLLGGGVIGILLSVLSPLLIAPVPTYALNGFIDPNADGTLSGFGVTGGGGGHFGAIDDGTRQPTAPNTGDLISAGANSGAVDFFRMSSLISVQSVSQVTIWAYHNDGTNAQFSAQLYDDNESTTRSSASAFAQISSNGWNSVTFSGLSLTQAQLDSLSLRISITRNGGGQPATGELFALYADVTYSAGVQISLTTDGTVDFGAIAASNTRDTTSGDLNDLETVSINGDPVDLDVRSSSFSDGGNTWTLGGSAGSNQIHFEFSEDGSAWTTFAVADTLYSLDTNVLNGATRDLYLRLTAPSTSGSLNPHSGTVTIVASAP